MTKVSIISIVDDDNSVRESLHSLLRSVGFSVHVFISAEDFLKSDHLDKTDCLILDVRMPGMTGIELQRQLKAQGCQIPIIFISAHADEETRTQALSAGAVAFLAKPLNEEMVLTALKAALNDS
jgi:FixJ family two-component response regulator